jgi:CelD/BcsL family acetyltransferase involved in cellulose biosynthesis
MRNLTAELITDLKSLEKVRKHWDKIYLSDPNTNLYNSFDWIKCWILNAGKEWLVLSVKDKETDNYTCFLPLALHRSSFKGINLLKKAFFGGHPYLCYSGLVCLQDHEKDSINTLSVHLSRLGFDSIFLKWFRDPRYTLIENVMSKAGYATKVAESLESLVIDLPDDFDKLLMQNLSRSSRRKIRTKYSIIENNERIRLTVSTRKNIQVDIDFLCNLWNERWEKKAQKEFHHQVLNHFFELDRLRLTLLWVDQSPIAALAVIIDPEKKIYNNYITAYQKEHAAISPGIVLLTESIKHAINKHYSCYDLTVGLDPYKLTFGPNQQKTYDIRLNRKSAKNYMVNALSRNKK